MDNVKRICLLYISLLFDQRVRSLISSYRFLFCVFVPQKNEKPKWISQFGVCVCPQFPEHETILVRVARTKYRQAQTHTHKSYHNAPRYREIRQEKKKWVRSCIYLVNIIATVGFFSFRSISLFSSLSLLLSSISRRQLRIYAIN